MLSWITEKQDVWQRLQSCNKPVVVYGMGDGAVKILQVMQRYGIRPAAMFASDDFARGNSFMGYTVGKLRDVQAVYDDFIIVLAFAVRDLPTIERIRALSQQYELVAPDVPVAGVELFNMEFVRRHEQDFLQVEQLLADEQSRKVLHDMVNFKLSGKLEYLFDCETRPAGGLRKYSAPDPARELCRPWRLPRGHHRRADALRRRLRAGVRLRAVPRPTPSCWRRWSRWDLPTELPVCSARHIPTGRCWSLTAARAGSRRCGSLRW